MNAPNQVSFLPDNYLDRKMQRRTNVVCLLLAVAVMGGIGSAFTLSQKEVRRVEAEQTTIDREYAEAAQRITLVKEMQDKQRRMAHQAELSASLLERVPRSNLLAEVTNALPPGVSLLEFNMDSRKKIGPAVNPAATAAPGAAPAATVDPRMQPVSYDVSFRLTGVAATDVQVAQYINRLSHSSLLSDVNLVISDEYALAGDHVRRFTIEMKLAPDAIVRPGDVKPMNDTTAVELGVN